MNEIVIASLAKRLLKCPFDGEIFDSSLSLRLHLGEAHSAQICQQVRLARPASVECSERPKRLYCCPHCDFAVPEPYYESPTTVITNHICTEHPNPSGPTNVGFRPSDDESVIDLFVESQKSFVACACSRCPKNFADDASVAEHWLEMHCDEVTIEEARRAYDADSERFRVQMAEIFSEVAEEEIRKRLTFREPDDGYVIHHVPSVPLMRSRPGEYDVFIERERVTFLDRELDELLEREGWDIADDDPFGTEWSEGSHQRVTVELRFCNIMDGYIPLVKDIRSILPPTADGEIVKVAWEGEPEFDCKVSRSKRAIYNREGKLISVFAPFPSGVRLNITRVGLRRYQLGVKRQPHRVPNCKWFDPDGRGGWIVRICDEEVEWETGDEVFRHQLNFAQMEALHHEARVAGISVRDAVHTAMKRLAQSQPVHVRTVHDAVFLFRTCSLAAVWAQFRPEHSCYERVRPGWYRFDPAGHFPAVHYIEPRINRLPTSPRDRRRYKIRGQGWRHNIFPSRLNEYREIPDAVLDVCLGFGTSAEARFFIPIPYLIEQVIPRAHCNERNQYLFSVSPYDHVFTWDYGVRMEGKQFLQDAD